MSVWSFGLRALIAPSFGDIFFNNCFKRGLLPIRLAEGDVDKLFAYLLPRPGATVTVDLLEQKVIAESMSFAFDIGGIQKMCLVKGLDEVSVTDTYGSELIAFENAYDAEFPWLSAQLQDPVSSTRS